MHSRSALVLYFLAVYSEAAVPTKNFTRTDASPNLIVASRGVGVEQKIMNRRDSKAFLDGYIERDDNLTLQASTSQDISQSEDNATIVTKSSKTKRNTIIPENYTFDSEHIKDIGNTAKIIKMLPDKVKEKSRKKPVNENDEEEEEDEDDELIREYELATKNKLKPAAISEGMFLIISKKMLTTNILLVLMTMMTTM